MSLNDDILETDIGKYTNLHAHSVYSPLDGFTKIDDYVQRAKALGMRGVCFTEHGNTFGHYDLWSVCKKHGMKPIFANEMYIAPGSGLVKEKTEGYKYAYHVIIIAYNNTGYNNLLKLTSDSWTKFKYYKPRTSFEELAKHSEGLICLSACLGGFINQMYLEGRHEEAEDIAKKFKTIFGPNFYLELIWTNMQEQIGANQFLKDLSIKLDIPTVITCDSHYTYKDESDLHAALVSINTGASFKKKKASTEVEVNKDLVGTDKDTDDNGLFYTAGEYYLKPYHVLAEHFNDAFDEESFANSNKIADMCDVKFVTGMTVYPQISNNPDQELLSKGMEFIDSYTAKHGLDKQAYVDRLLIEIDVISKMDFSNYFLVVEDYVKYAQSIGVLTGPGRGSAAGSLVAFTLGITMVDPIKYGLLFSRMLNRGRAKQPLIEFKDYPLSQYGK